MRFLRFLAAVFALLPAARLSAALSDYRRTERKVASLPPSVRLVEWSRRKGLLPARAWTVRFDLSDPQLRFTTRLGLCNDRSATNRVATLDEMAASLVAEGRRPIVGLNGNYFDAVKGRLNVYGPVVSDGRVLITGGGTLLVETEDHGFVISSSNRISSAAALAADGKRILNATGFYAEPVVRYDHGVYRTKDNPTYPRAIVGVGKRVLVFLVADGRQPLWSVGVDDRDAVDMAVSEGAEMVAEGDGGGSASLWVADLEKELTPRDKNYVNRPSDGRPRRVGEGVFMLYDPPARRKGRDKGK